MYISLTVTKRLKIPHSLSALLFRRWGELVPLRDPTVIRRKKRKNEKKNRPDLQTRYFVSEPLAG